MEIAETVPQHTETHGGFDHVNAVELEVVHGVEGRDPTGVGLGQSQQLLGGSGDGLARWVMPGGWDGERLKLVFFGRNRTKNLVLYDPSRFMDKIASLRQGNKEGELRSGEDE